MEFSRRELPLAFLRIAIGWHFLYEGWAKLLQPGWTSAAYLKSSTGPLAGVFQWMASDAAVVKAVDLLNIWGLVGIGLALMLGLFARAAAWSGIGLLALYYVAYPPLFAPLTHGTAEGTYIIVNKNLVELAALAVLAMLPATAFGLDSLLRKRAATQPVPALPAAASRREVLAGLVGVPFVGALVLSVLRKHGWRSFEEMNLVSRAGVNDKYLAGATMKTFQFSSVSDLKGRLPYGKIGNLTMTRMILGGNLMGGWAHARDLIYVSSLVKQYHHRNKIFETLAIAERCGVNTILTNPLLCGVVNDYWRNGGKIQFISDCGGKDVLGLIQKSIDAGASACYIQGAIADRLVKEGNFDLIAKGLDLIRKNKIPGGIGGHRLSTIQGCVDKGLRPDFWMKTLHRVDYWSAKTEPENDNNWCEDPEACIAYMRELKEPWIAFKILAAGSIHPKVGFKYAFEAGADFICVGMYDFQIVDDVNLAHAVLNGSLVRQRNWCA